MQVRSAQPQRLTDPQPREPQQHQQKTVAWCCCQTVGLASDANSIPYLAGWAQNASLDVLQRAAQLCDRLARRIEDTLLSHLPDPDAGAHPPAADTPLARA